MINDCLDIARWRKEFAEKGRVQIESYLQEDAANLLGETLLTRVPFQLAYRNAEGVSKCFPIDTWSQLTDDQRRDFVLSCERESTANYGFAYDCYQMIGAYHEQRDLDLPLHRVLEFFNSTPYLEFVRTLTGLRQIRRVSAQATRYLPGHFLRRHNDADEAEGRLVAYVINLTTQWQSDWGGLLHFHSADDGILETFVPRFNSLSLFRVPVMHSVSRVCDYAQSPRLSITGWLMS